MKKGIIKYICSLAAVVSVLSCTKGEVVTEAVDQNASVKNVAVEATLPASSGEGMLKAFTGKENLNIRFTTADGKVIGRTQSLKYESGEGAKAVFSGNVAVPDNAAKYIVFFNNKEVTSTNFLSAPTANHLDKQTGTLDDAVAHQVMCSTGDVSALSSKVTAALAYKTSIVKVVATFPKNTKLADKGKAVDVSMAISCNQLKDVILESGDPAAASKRGDIVVNACSVDTTALKATAYFAVWPEADVYSSASLICKIDATTYGADFELTSIEPGKSLVVAQEVETRAFNLWIPDEEYYVENVRGTVVKADEWITFNGGKITVAENNTGKIREGKIEFNNGTSYTFTQIGVDEFKGTYEFTSKLFGANNKPWCENRGLAGGTNDPGVITLTFGDAKYGETLEDQDGKKYTNQIGISGLHGDAVMDATVVIDYEAHTAKLGLLLDARKAQVTSESNVAGNGYVCFLPEMGTSTSTGWASPWNFVQADLDADPAKDFLYLWLDCDKEFKTFSWNSFANKQFNNRSKKTAANCIIGITCAVAKSEEATAANVYGTYNVIFQANVKSTSTIPMTFTKK